MPGFTDELVVLRSLRLPETELRRISKALAERMKEDVPCVPRAPRYAYRVRGGIELVLQPDGVHRMRYLVDPLDLSNTGIGLMHGNFVHLGTPCELYLRTIDGEIVRVSGKVARCNCFCAPVHILGVNFDTRIEVHDYITPPETAERKAPEPPVRIPGVPYIPPGTDAERLRSAMHELGTLIFAGASVEIIRKRYEQLCGQLLAPYPAAVSAR
ncbi:MAG TPA: hypothetical protein P5572_05195 [Phycisphaerae bacterium]|nr:hypothetical protein [Phycisphaerae bacterium]